MITLQPGQNEVSYEKDKDARKDLRFSLADILPPGETLASITWSDVAGITIDGLASNATDCVAFFSGGVPQKWYTAIATWVSSPSGASDQFAVRLFIKDDAEALSDLGSALFPNKFTAVSKLRRDPLMMAMQTHFAGAEITNEYVWDKLQAAESEMSHTLRVKFAPTTFFPVTPSQAQIDALNGAPWAEDPAYDYDPDMFKGDSWGFILTRNKPVIAVQELRYAYPSDTQGFNYTIPLDWIKLDKKYGQIRIVPTSNGGLAMLNSYLMQMMGAGRVIPQMLNLTYVAGLANPGRDFPELIDAVKKLAVLKIIEDGFLPQSGSISADGLSQSQSLDMSKYEDSIDRIVNGPKGSNGGLMTAIHGIRLGVM